MAILAALWSASGGVGNIVTAINLAYDEVETRNFFKLKATSLLLTLGAIVFVLITFGLVAVVPIVLDALPLGVVGTILAQVLRWVLLLAVFAGALAVLYRVAPDRDDPKLRWVSLGSIAVTVVWALVSLGFSFYVDNFGSYDKTYGAIAGVIVLMLWLYLTCYLVLLGAEINSEAEHQTAQDTTSGEPQPMGERGRRRWPTRCPSRRSRRRATATRPGSSSAQRTCEGTNGGRTTCTVCGRPRTSTASSAPSSMPAAVSSSASAMPVRRVGENVPLVTSPTRFAGRVEHRHAGARDAPAVGAQAPQQPGGPGLLLGEQRLPAPERRLLPADRPAGPGPGSG